MRITLDLLGHHVEFTIDHPNDVTPGEREGSADALVERSDPWRCRLCGFGPTPRTDDR